MAPKTRTRLKGDIELIAELIEYHYDEFSEAVVTSWGAPIGEALKELDRRHCDEYHAKELRAEFEAEAEFRNGENQWFARGR